MAAVHRASGWTLFTLLTACTEATPDRHVHVLETRPPLSSGTTEATLLPPPSDGSCLPTERGDDDLVPTFCRRVSPEPERQPQDRCAYYNLLGALGLSGPPEAPIVQYCDGDRSGGLRLGQYDPGQGVFVASRLLPAGACDPIFGNGGLASTAAGGLVSSWTALDLEDGGSPAWPAWTATVDLGSGSLGAPVELVGDAIATDVPDGGPDVRFAVDWRGRLWSIGLTAQRLGEVSGPIAVAGNADGALVAACTDAGVHVFFVDAAGAPVGEMVVDGPCDPDLAPAVAVGDDGWLAAWTGPEGTEAATFSVDGHERARMAVGPAGAIVGPAAAAAGSAFLVVDGTGAGLVLDGAGTAVRTFRHPAIAAWARELRQLRVAWDGERAAFAIAWGHIVPIGPHVDVHDELQVDGARLSADGG